MNVNKANQYKIQKGGRRNEKLRIKEWIRKKKEGEGTCGRYERDIYCTWP